MKNKKLIKAIIFTIISIISIIAIFFIIKTSSHKFVKPSPSSQPSKNLSSINEFSSETTYMSCINFDNYIITNNDFAQKLGSYIASSDEELKQLDQYLNLDISNYFSNIPTDEKDNYYYFITIFCSIKSEKTRKLKSFIQDENKLYFNVEYSSNKHANKTNAVTGLLEKNAMIAAIPKSNIDISNHDTLVNNGDNSWILVNSMWDGALN